MSDGFGIFSSVVPPILDPVSREEKLGRENPRQQRERKRTKARSQDTVTPPADADSESQPATHVDLRV